MNNKSVSEAKEDEKLDESIDLKLEQSLEDSKDSSTTPQKSPIEIYKENIANKVSLFFFFSSIISTRVSLIYDQVQSFRFLFVLLLLLTFNLIISVA